MKVEAVTIVRSGLVLLATGVVQRAEPDVGIFSPFVEDLEFFWLPKRAGDKRRPISDKMLATISKQDLELAEEELLWEASQ